VAEQQDDEAGEAEACSEGEDGVGGPLAPSERGCAMCRQPGHYHTTCVRFAELSEPERLVFRGQRANSRQLDPEDPEDHTNMCCQCENPHNFHTMRNCPLLENMTKEEECVRGLDRERHRATRQRAKDKVDAQYVREKDVDKLPLLVDEEAVGRVYLTSPRSSSRWPAAVCALRATAASSVVTARSSPRTAYR
jgi:hypothetical protein